MDAFGASRQRFDAICTVLQGEGAGGLEHSELEARLDRDGREPLRQLMQDHLARCLGQDVRQQRRRLDVRRRPQVYLAALQQPCSGTFAGASFSCWTHFRAATGRLPVNDPG